MSGQARTDAGFNLRRVQQGERLAMPLSRPMPTVGSGCHELRIGDVERDAEWRVIYCADDLAIVVLEIWQKQTRETPERVLRVCQERLSRYLAAKRGTKDG